MHMYPGGLEADVLLRSACVLGGKSYPQTAIRVADIGTDFVTSLPGEGQDVLLR